MAANYWNSTQRLHWTFSKAKLQEMRRRLEEEDRNLIQQNPLPERRLLSIHFCHQITKLGKRLNVRQQALATAQVYVRRFYTKVEIRRTNPYLVLATAFYLACKMEECPQHIRLVVGEARNTWPGKHYNYNSIIHFTDLSSPDLVGGDISKLGECEFSLISEMNSQLIIHHPYRSLSELQTSFPLTQDETALAWSVINDHYLTDLPLLYPPHVIAITAAFLAVVLRPTQNTLQVHAASAAAALQSLSNTQAASGPKIQKLVDWMAEGSVDIEAVVDCMQELISLYEVWEQFNDKVCKEQIARFVKSRGLDK